jgi:hypothetical protein
VGFAFLSLEPPPKNEAILSRKGSVLAPRCSASRSGEDEGSGSDSESQETKLTATEKAKMATKVLEQWHFILFLSIEK